ncbi:unnamed protein product [Haemonchus placei]|uniref:Uncharacterized protein n=1 Tax=Haemonchus placei TaxID=6290 RepID=A0A0N4W5F9_HAEPC|nr:unnamed protein product [Haemonchus placei]
MIASSDLQMNAGNSIDADYEELMGKITQAVKVPSTAKEPARRRRIPPAAVQMMTKRARMKPEGRVQTADYKELCEAIRKKIECNYEGYRRKLRGTERSLEAVGRDSCLRHHIESALKNNTGVKTAYRRMKEIRTKFFKKYVLSSLKACLLKGGSRESRSNYCR